MSDLEFQSLTASVTKIIPNFFLFKVAFIAMSDVEFLSVTASLTKNLPTFFN